MPSMDTQELADLYESLQDLSDGVGDVDDVFEEVAGYVNGMRSAMAEREQKRDLVKSRNEDIDMLAEALESAVYSLETAETNASVHASWPEKARHALEHVNSETTS